MNVREGVGAQGWKLVPLIIVAVTLLSSCWGGSEQHTSDDPFAPLPKVEQAKVEVPKDRDPRAVEEALRRIDACALLEPLRSRIPSAGPAHLTRDGPHSCELYDGESMSVNVSLGSALRAHDRFAAHRFDLAGAAAYRVGRSHTNSCEIAIPVSQLRIVRFNVTAPRPGDEGCRLAKRLLPASIVALRHPVSIPTAPDAGTWSACRLLTSALGGKVPRKHVLQMDEVVGVDGCRLYKRDEGRSALTGEPYGPDRTPFYVSVGYGWVEGFDATGKARIRGKTVAVDSHDGCGYRWNQWPTVRGTDRPGLIRLHAPSCRRAKEMVKLMMRALDDSPRPNTTVAPQRPLLYDFGESDRAIAAGCLDFPPDIDGTCRPYVKTDVPDDPVELIRHAEADPNVNCAFAADEVRRRFGAGMHPMTVETRPLNIEPSQGSIRACLFVHPSHKIRVDIRLTSTSMLTLANFVNDHESEHPAYESRSGDEHVLVVALDDQGEPGTLIVAVVRGEGDAAMTRSAKRMVGEADELAADLAKAHLSPDEQRGTSSG